jgi:hypothetical protein
MRDIDIPPTLRTFAALVAEATLRDGGVTVNAHTREFLGTPDTPTYVVGGTVPVRTYDARGFGPNEIFETLSRVASSLDAGLIASSETWVGTWVDDGTVYVDLVDLIDNYDDALSAAVQRGERAIYAAHTGETHWTPGNDPNSPESWARAIVDAGKAPDTDTGPSDLEDPAALMAEDASDESSFIDTARNGRAYDTRYDCHICGRPGGH